MTVFYDPCNIIQKNNFGISNNTYVFFLLFLCKFFLIFFNVFNLTDVQEIIKLGFTIGLMLVSLILITKNTTKFFNIYQNMLTLKISFLFYYSLFCMTCFLTGNKINMLIFFLSFSFCLIISYLTLELIFYLKINNLYARVISNFI